ncbi:membrane protein insertase YidC [Buchnera aphidicola (Kurisakia onigurumii)]|uniref:membrane protein insertase YidC n=1 Tax=Buchnera aphidicola TaxID=9 RepID=UPI0031B6ACBD
MDLLRNFFIFSIFGTTLFFFSFLKQSLGSNENFLHKKQNITSSIHKNKNNDSNIIVKTDVLKVIISKKGGDIKQAKLLKFNKNLKTKLPIKLLDTNKNFVYQAQSGLIGPNGIDNFKNNKRPIYSTQKNFFDFTNSKEKELRVPMTIISKDGSIYTKTFIFKKKEYSIQVEFSIFNNSKKTIKVSMLGQLVQTINIKQQKKNIKNSDSSFRTLRGSAFSSHNNKYKKYTFDKIKKEKDLNITTKSGWVAMIQKYFVSAWIPKNNGNNTIYTHSCKNNTTLIGYKSDLIKIKPNSKTNINSILWVGPEIQEKMASISPYLDLTVDYGWLWFLSQPLFKLLKFLYYIFGNWGIAIIGITVITKIFMHPFNRLQYISMQKIKSLNPKINNIKEKYSSDKKKMTQEIINLYKRENINPLSSIFPVLIQMPIFLSLYYMLMGSVELRHAPFIFWIQDLSSQDPYFILPILMGISMYFSQNTNFSQNQTNNSTQEKIMKFFPFIFIIFFLWFPAGLVLYYTVSNILTILQQKLFFYKFNK